MFNKLLSNLPFNPSLIGQISFYAKRLRQESSIRRLGFVMLVLAMLVQLFAFISPPEPTLATSNNDLINGGITEQGQAVQHCLNIPNEDFNIILNHYGINCTDLDYGHSSVVRINANDYDGQLFSMGRLPYGKPGEQPVNVPGANGGSPLYIRYLWGWGNADYTALSLIMHGQQFFILFDCGNLVSVGIPQPHAPDQPVTPVTPTPAPTPQPPADKPAIGYLDVVDCNKIAGWAFDQSKPANSIEVHIYIDGVGAAITQANQSRPDVGAAFPGAGNNHGYSIATPASLKNSSSHRVDTYAIGIDENGNKNNANPLIGTKTVTLGSCTTPTNPTPTAGNASCSGLQRIDLTHRSYIFVATTTGTNYTVKSYVFDFGDKTPKVTKTTALKMAAVEHNYAKPGPYTAKVTILVSVQGSSGSTDKTLQCQNSFTINEVSTPPEKTCEDVQSSQNLAACLLPHKIASNTTQGLADANGTTAHAGDVIEYIISTTNIGSVTVPNHLIQESISDILDYADVVDLHGGTLDSKGMVSWPKQDIKAKQTITKQITVKIKDPIPNTPISASDGSHFDHTMTNVYGDTVNIKLPDTVVSLTDKGSKNLPNTGPGTTLIVAVSLTVVVGYFFARSRLLAKEIDLVRSDYAATGGI